MYLCRNIYQIIPENNLCGLLISNSLRRVGIWNLSCLFIWVEYACPPQLDELRTGFLVWKSRFALAHFLLQMLFKISYTNVLVQQTFLFRIFTKCECKRGHPLNQNKLLIRPINPGVCFQLPQVFTSWEQFPASKWGFLRQPFNQKNWHTWSNNRPIYLVWYLISHSGQEWMLQGESINAKRTQTDLSADPLSLQLPAF